VRVQSTRYGAEGEQVVLLRQSTPGQGLHRIEGVWIMDVKEERTVVEVSQIEIKGRLLGSVLFID